MKRLLFILLTFISLNIFAQSDSFKVKEGSFHKIDGCVTIPARTDVNDLPMGVIKIIPDNINEQQRMRLTFEGNLAMGIEVEPKEGETWVYVTARAVTFLRIKHPDFGVTEFYPPMEIEANQCYEMVLQYVAASESETGFLAISSEPNEADVYVDGKHYGKTTAVVTDLAEGSHTLKLEKQGYVTLTKTINIVKGETLKLNETLQTLSSQKTYLIVKADQPDAMIYIDDEPINTGEASKSVTIGSTHTYKIECNLYHSETGTITVTDRVTVDKKLRPNFGYINVTTSPEQGAKVYVDGKYIGESPIKTDKLASGTHTVRVMKEMYKMKEQTFTVNDGQTTNANITMEANFVNVTINTDSDADIYVDGDYKGKGRWTGKLSEGLHNVEARKANHKPTAKTLDLVLGATQTITLDAPKPINGSVDVNSSPMGATIYIDGKSYGETPNYIDEIIIGTHELKLEKQGCVPITKTITIKENETLNVNEKLQTGKEIVIKTDKSGDKVYVDNNYVGLSPVTTSLAFGSHTIKAERDGKTTSKTITVSQYGGDNSVMLAFVQEINGHEYVDLGLSVKWATCNVGANKPEDYGNYYAWGETSTKSSYTESNSKTYGKQMNDIKGNSQYDAARANWGGTWRLPTKAELEELENKCTWTWTTQNGVKGCKVTGPNGNSIFLPAAGDRDGPSLYNAGGSGDYWSSTPDDSDYAYRLGFGSGGQLVFWRNRYRGRSVRPVSE